MCSEAGEQQFWRGRGAAKAQTTLYSVEYCSLILKQYVVYRFKKNSGLLLLVNAACVQERAPVMESVR